MNLSSRLSLISHSEPFVEAAGYTKCADFGLEGADGIVVSHVFIKHFERHIVSDVLDVKVESLVPLWHLSSVLMCLCFEARLSHVNDNERVHLAKELCVSGQFGFNYSNSEVSLL